MKMIREFQLNLSELSQSDRVLAAVSTGVDSMVMLQLLLSLPFQDRPQISVAYVNHQLRAASEQETDFIKSFCQQHHLPLFMTSWPRSQHPKHGIEAAARDFRYHFFAEVMRKQQINQLLTAHHRDDQVETFLLKLIRGGQLQQLKGIAAKRNFSLLPNSWILRPLLPFTKDQLRTFARQEKIEYFEDETNAELTVQRNRLRNRLIPELVTENPQFKEHIIDYQQQLGCLQAAIQPLLQQKLQLITIDQEVYSLASWQRQAKPWQQLLLKKILSIPRAKVVQQQQAEALQLLSNLNKPQGRISLGKNYFFFKEYNRFGIIYRQANSTTQPTNFHCSLEFGKWHRLDDGNQIGLFKWNPQLLQPHDQVFKLTTNLFFPLSVRHRKKGDRLLMTNGSQKVKKILIDHKIAQSQRNNLWLLTNNQDQPIWLIGVKHGHLSEAAVNGRIQYMIIFRNEVAL
ncbi:tRNA lysidine(34) synthetase TilS [Liquorilactobacillus nagelii]|jgi:tRNA(Ile)-lysidine synthase|uniref:tRNA lysidine(34) synthetase TilS n=1 Tax=Liquorilactobacillus nagelii TaxID=82688 RepID=UPI001CCC8A1F|nr:tRNA lysidine(34) synthetase TilS [Liquorilactobacillus nagelii]MCI1700167.1 tRNA lysidine(34) synthetase TilS [Liquorilactobacillus nagelii]ULQ48798.1 tRNA lysidine(34) synthetase TilS [Liquorilactobacillus nagelii]